MRLAGSFIIQFRRNSLFRRLHDQVKHRSVSVPRRRPALGATTAKCTDATSGNPHAARAEAVRWPGSLFLLLISPAEAHAALSTAALPAPDQDKIPLRMQLAITRSCNVRRTAYVYEFRETGIAGGPPLLKWRNSTATNAHSTLPEHTAGL